MWLDISGIVNSGDFAFNSEDAATFIPRLLLGILELSAPAWDDDFVVIPYPGGVEWEKAADKYTVLLTTVPIMGSTRELHFLFSVLFPICLYLATVIPSRSQYSTSAVMSHSQTALLALQYYLTTRVQLLVGQDLWYRLNILLHMNKVQWKKIIFFYTNIAVDGFTLEDLILTEQ